MYSSCKDHQFVFVITGWMESPDNSSMTILVNHSFFEQRRDEEDYGCLLVLSFHVSQCHTEKRDDDGIGRPVFRIITGTSTKG